MINKSFQPAGMSEKECAYVNKILKKYILGIFISRDGGDILFPFQIDPKLKIELISQFISALAIFGEENVGKIKRIMIEGLDVEISILKKHSIVCTAFFRPNMVKDHLTEEAEKALNLFYKIFEEEIKAGKTNQLIFQKFDENMCLLIRDYLVRIGVLKNKNIEKY